MRDFDQLQKDPRTVMQNIRENGATGYLFLPQANRRMYTFFAADGEPCHGTLFEYVAFAPMLETEPPISLAEIREVKNIFWMPDEEVHLIFPASQEFFQEDGFGAYSYEHAAHLWKPKAGWRSLS